MNMRSIARNKSVIEQDSHDGQKAILSSEALMFTLLPPLSFRSLLLCYRREVNGLMSSRF